MKKKILKTNLKNEWKDRIFGIGKDQNGVQEYLNEFYTSIN